jgi:nitrite reductase/ring-hydroxylating ferredoxin subunit
VDEEQAAQVRTAIALRAARPGSDAPSEEFRAALHRRLAADLEPAPRPGISRRRLVQATSLAAASAVAGALVEHTAGAGMGAVAEPQQPELLMPNAGTWRTVAASAELDGGTVRDFDLGTVNGFVRRRDGHLLAVSGVCTHLGCRLALSGGATPELVCPCHRAAFSTDGAVIRHQLPRPLRPLPRLAVREINGSIQVFAPE